MITVLSGVGMGGDTTYYTLKKKNVFLLCRFGAPPLLKE